MIIIKKTKLTRQNLYICLRDSVLTWYIDVFNDDQKRLLKLSDEIEEWKRTLLKRWKKSSITIMTMITKKKYIMKNVRKHREFFEFVQIIIRKVKSTLMFVFFQIYLIYNDLKLKFKRNLNKSNENITMNFFLQELKNNKKIWWNLDNKHRYTNQLFDFNRVQNNYRSSKQIDNYINFFSFDVRQNNDDYNSVEFISTTNVISQRQTQYSIFYQFERQNIVYRSSQYQSNYQYRFQQNQQTFQNQSERAQSYENQQFKFQFASFEQQRNASNSRFQFFRSNSNFVEISSKIYVSFKQKIYSNLQKTSNREFRRTYFTNETNENLFSSEKENYQEENENKNIDASKIFTSKDAYHDQKNDEIEEFKTNYEYNEKVKYFANTSTIQMKIHTCRRCQSEFYSNNKFHRHLRQCQIMTISSFSTSTQKIQFFQNVIIQSNVKFENSFVVEFRFFRYATMKINIEDIFTNICVNIECETLLIDKNFLIQKIFNYQEFFRQIKKSLKIRKIDDVSIEAKIYIVFKIQMSNTNENDKSTIKIFIRRVFVVKHMKTKIFFDNNIFELKQMNINVEMRILIINNCKDLVVQLNLINFESQVKRIVCVNEAMKISINFAIIISFKFSDKSTLSRNRDFMFHFAKIAKLKNEDDILSHIIDAHTEMIQIHNTNFEDVFISKNNRLKIVQEYKKEDCYLINQKYANLIANVHKSISRNWFKSTLKMNVSTMIVDATMTTSIENSTTKFATNFVAISINFETEIINFVANFLSSSYHVDENQFFEQILSSKITIYDDFEIRDKFFNVVDSYSDLWNDNDFIVKISANE